MSSLSGKIIFCFVILFFPVTDLLAHTINYGMEVKPVGNVIAYYTWLGFQHILPGGLDHILFVVGLFLLDSRIRTVIYQASFFTIGHTITLILSSMAVIVPPSQLVEPVIAASILFVAIENIYSRQTNRLRYVIIFLFGLVHGMGFASALNETGLPRNTFFTSLISFNIGVELGQVTVILVAYLLVGKWFSRSSWYRARIVNPISFLIAITAVYWTVERILDAG